MFRLTRLCVCLAAGLAVLCTSCTGGSPPDDPTNQPSRSASASVSPSPGTSEPSPNRSLSPDEQALLDKVRAEGHTKVLVELRLRQTPAAKDARKAAIADAQDELQAELEPLGVQIDTRFELYALVSLEANEAALLQLFESSLVERVHENQVHKPQS